MPKHARLMVVFGVILILCGFLGWASTNFEARAKTAILSGTVCGLRMAASGWLAGRRQAWQAQIGFILGLTFSGLFGLVFVWRAAMGWLAYASGQPKFFTASLITCMAVGSMAVFAQLLRIRKTTV